MRARALLFVVALLALSASVGGWLWERPYARVDRNVRSAVSAAAAPNSPPELASSTAPTPATPPIDTVRTRTPPLESTRNVLIVGLDRRADGQGAGLTDTIIVAVLDTDHGHLGLVGVPRDLYVDIPDHGTDRINVVWNLARRDGKDPIEALGRVIEDTLGLPIEHGLAIDLGVFERAVDAVGGVTVDVPCPIVDRFIDPREPNGRRVLNVEAGRVAMDGPTAAMYVRSRHGRSDWSRARRQQAVLVGLRQALSSAGGITTLPALWDELGASLTTDMRRIELLGLARRVLAVDASHLHGLVIGYKETRGLRTAEGRSVLVPEPDAIRESLSKLFSAPLPGTPLLGSVCEAADVAIADGGS
jgi:polyisoprenyl-teichoic acid--peptidoglycan teichoic acid transferase